MAAKRKVVSRKVLAKRVLVKKLGKYYVPARPKVLILLKKQSGKQTKYGRKVDRKLPALGPGKRVSRKGKVYWETRKNRSDLGKTL